MPRALVILALAAACLLNSCYTTLNQQWREGHRRYVGYNLDYQSHKKDNSEQPLPAVLYRCGDDWYLAGRSCEFTARMGLGHRHDADFYTRRTFYPHETQPAAVRYHKITPELAERLRVSDLRSYAWFRPTRVEEEMHKAGGEWIDTLPPGAKAEPALFLKTGNLALPIVTAEHDSTPLYAYPLVALTFVALDVPLTIISSFCFITSERERDRSQHYYAEQYISSKAPQSPNR